MPSIKEMRTRIIIILLILGWLDTMGQSVLQSGPMAGYSSMREVGVWVQTTAPAHVSIVYHEAKSASKRDTSISIQTVKSNGYIAHIPITDLEPNTKYEYELLINDKIIERPYDLFFQTQKLWQWRTSPPDFKFVVGSCVYVSEEQYDRPGTPYGGQYKIFSSIVETKPEFMIWLGDNTYYREVDWDSRSGIYYRNTHTRSVKELQPLLGSVHHYAIWDDHDYGPNDSDRSFHNKDITKEAFKDFWYNPNYGVGNTEGITGFHSWNDCDFFMLDNRWYRSPEEKEGQIIGKAQIDWLIDALRFSRASFKFICIGGQFVSNLAEFENHANFETERTYLLEQIRKYKIQNVIFLNGDRHHSEISKMLNGDQIIYEITSSPLTSGAYDHESENNTNRVIGSMIGQRNFAEIDVTGEKENRQVKVTFKSTEGVELYSYTITKQ